MERQVRVTNRMGCQAHRRATIVGALSSCTTADRPGLRTPGAP